MMVIPFAILLVIVVIVLAKSGVSDGISTLIVGAIVNFGAPIASGVIAGGLTAATVIGIPFAPFVGIFVAYKVFRAMRN